MQMIEAERQQCLEEAQEENDTAGELPPHPWGKRGAPGPPQSPAPPHRRAQVHVAFVAHSLEGGAPGSWGAAGWQGEDAGRSQGVKEKEGPNRPPCSQHPPQAWGAPSCYLGRSYKLGFRKVSEANCALGGSYPFSPGKVGMMPMAASWPRTRGPGHCLVGASDNEDGWVAHWGEHFRGPFLGLRLRWS